MIQKIYTLYIFLQSEWLQTKYEYKHDTDVFFNCTHFPHMRNRGLSARVRSNILTECIGMQKLSQARGIRNVTLGYAVVVRPRNILFVTSATLYTSEHFIPHNLHMCTCELAVCNVYENNARWMCIRKSARMGTAASARDFPARGRVCVHMRLW